ncbi:MAG TPA: glycosyltransferase family 39 protein [Acetobacteraceae bacterium]|nr:glycosyltransferase family 39 protein [Acetobacteraceae bacterium]
MTDRNSGRRRAPALPGPTVSGNRRESLLPLLPAIILALLTLIRLVVAASSGLSPDEAYYWVWSRALAPGYLDAPPMVALWIRAGTAIAGPGTLGIRALAPLSALLGTGLLVAAAEDLVPGRQAGLVAAALLNATVLFGVGAVTMTPDTPLLFFWTLALFAMGRLLATGEGRWWLLAGAAIGCAMLSKYTALLLAIGVALWLVVVPAARPWLRRWQPWAAAALSVAIFAPDLAWNAAHHWASYIKQGGRTGVWHPADALRYLGELVGGQAGLATPLVFVLCVCGVWWAARRGLRGDPAAGLLALLTVPGALVFLEHAVGGRVQANWPAVLYPAAAVAACALRWRPWRSAAAIGFAMTALVYLQATAAPWHLPPKQGAVFARLAGWPELGAAIDQARMATGARFVASDEYGLASELARTLPGFVPVVAAAPRWRLFALPSAAHVTEGQVGLLVQSVHRSGLPDAAPWASITRIGRLSRIRHGTVAEDYRLYRVVGAPAGGGYAVLLPRPDIVGQALTSIPDNAVNRARSSR